MLLSFLSYGPIPTMIDRWKYTKRPEGILLTFDDGPDPRYTPKLLELLDEFQVKAMFFCLGKKVRRYPELMHDIIARGHTIGLHGFTHRNAWLSTPKQVKKNVRLGQRQLIKLGLETNLYRPPYGRVNLGLQDGIERFYWTKLFHDWDITSEEKLFEKMKDASRPGEIWLLHDGTEGKAKPDMPLVMLRVLRQWLDWERQQGISLTSERQ